MATTTIPWGDGSGDNIYLTYPSASGDQTVQVSSDANAGGARTKTVTFTSGVGNITKQLTISQESGRPPLPAEDGKVWAYYNANTTTSNTQILYSTSGISSMEVDGVTKTVATTYKFPTTGEHLIKYTLSAHSIANSQFRNLQRATYIYVPSHVNSLVRDCFRSNATYLSGVIFRSETPATLGTNVFSGSTWPIYVPYSSDHSILTAYKSSWSAYSSRISELNPDGTLPS